MIIPIPRGIKQFAKAHDMEVMQLGHLPSRLSSQPRLLMIAYSFYEVHDHKQGLALSRPPSP